jgi:2'-5' RNA ligase
MQLRPDYARPRWLVNDAEARRYRKQCPAASHLNHTARMSAATYHLWLKPSGSTYDELAATIRELAQELNAPVFEPHVTLLSLEGSEREHVRRTGELAGQLEPFSVILTELSSRNEYFQCLFINVQQTTQVMDANALAKRIFHQAERAYAPHLSLLYGLYPEVRKREIIARLGSGVRTWFEASAIHLIQADSGDPKDWHELSIAPMRG